MWRAALRFKFMNNSYLAASMRTRRSEDQRAFSVVVSRIFSQSALATIENFGFASEDQTLPSVNFAKFRFITEYPELGVILELHRIIILIRIIYSDNDSPLFTVAGISCLNK